ncbi:RNA polymerase sigma factor SigX [Brevibacillus brevis]|uniref:RNA polymerase sigma factor SigX n=1 Tax=Brevibacillus brevis TaxID=1393 RepID=A0ABY9TCF7_BREBE|nr:RNA polymerase sigma factor SigX [Brevibacillus brevis]WNC17785.1 RNA polymerase sigma factor SigX [Brevibacillus brevis]
MEVQAKLAMDTGVVQDNTDSFRDLFTTYYPFVVRQIMRIVKEQQTAEDIAQDVFLSFYHTDRSAIEHIPAWLSRASIYAAYNHLRAEKRRTARQEKEAAEKEWVAPSSEDAWMEQDAIVGVRDVLAMLDERERTLLVMKYSGFAYAELARATGTEVSSVGTLLIRAKSKFRKLYDRMRGAET